MGRVQGLHRRGAHRRRAAQYDRLDGRHRLLRPQVARLAYRFQQRQCRGRGCGRRFHGQGQKHADRRGYVAHRRRFGPGASRHPADPFRPERSAAQILRRSRRRTGCGDRRPRVVRQAGRHTGQHGADRRQRPLQGAAFVVRHAARRLDRRGRGDLQPADDAAQGGAQQRAGRRGDAQPASGRAARPPRPAGQRDPLGLYRRSGRQRLYRRQRRGQRHAAGLQRLYLRLAAARRPPAQPPVRRPHHGPRSQP